MKNIIIGLSGAHADFEKNGFIKDYVNNHYADSMMKVGVTPIILPLTTDEGIIANYIDIIDGLILTGGDDINPNLFGEEFFPETQVPDLERDIFEMSLVKFAMKKKVPILGICRGMQLINVYFKGTLYQDLKYNKEIKLKHLQGMARPSIPVHKVIFGENSDLRELFSETLYVNSFHHQGVKKVGENLKIVAKSTDNLVEGIEYVADDQFILGVQRHPEMMYSNGDNKDMEKLFHYFIKKITR